MGSPSLFSHTSSLFPEQEGPGVPEQEGPRVPEQEGPRVPKLSRVLVDSRAEPLLLPKSLCILQTRRHTRLQRQLLRNASSGLTFSQDVVRDRGPSSLPYSQRDARGLFDPSGLLGPPARTKQRGTPRMDTPRHTPCHLWTGDRAKRRDPDSKGGPRGVPLVSEQRRETGREKEKGNEQPAVFLTEADSPPHGRVSARMVASLGASDKDGVRGQWDELLLAQISKTTAQGGHEARRQSLLRGCYGSSSATDLVPEDPMNTEDFRDCRELPPSSGIETVQKAVLETPLPLYYRQAGEEREGISSQVHQRDERRRDWIIMENTSEYRKNLQEQFPRTPEQWNKAGGARETTPKHTGVLRPVKGGRRWLALPSPADYTETGLRPPDTSWLDTRPVYPRTPHRPLQELSGWRYTVDEGRRAWKHMTRWQDVTVEGLKKDLTDMHCHVRVIAIATCASGAVNRPSPELNPSEEGALGRDADSWAAAQCLALEGEGSAAVVQRLISQLFDTDVEGDREQATALLARLTNTTTVVCSLLAEKLNSGNWRERTLSCHTLARLQGSFNKDLTNKLTFLMWNDWHSKVRQAAAQTLGRMGLGKEVFNQLLRMMQNEPVKEIKASAIHALGQTGHVTPALRELLLWALHHEEEPVVRFAAGDAIIALSLTGSDLQDLLLDRLSLEPHLLVRRKVTEIQAKLGFSQEGSKNLVHKVKQQVHRLCSKRIITQKVLRLEEFEDTLVQKALRIDLRTQPGLSDDPRDIARLLGDCFPAHSPPNSAPLQLESELPLYDTQSQSLSDTFRSSSAATRASFASPRTPTLFSHDTEDEEAEPQRPITRGCAKCFRSCGQSRHRPVSGSAVSLSHGHSCPSCDLEEQVL
ncbi:UNVERIFIED_CONTAM: hypothetical protein FKN15_018816 [Acipenser sinensis]